MAFAGLKIKIKKIRKLNSAIFADISGLGAVECPICGWKGKEFLPFGFEARKNAKCPNCGSLERHRLYYLYLKRKIPIYKNLKLLHFSPEKCLADFLRSYDNIEYLSADINSNLAMKKEDITNTSFENNSFDIIICSHILEHVAEDIKAMQELFRILKPGGFALIQVPNGYEGGKRKTTFEDFSINTPEERLKAFKHPEHVRIHGLDYKNKLKKAGFKVKIISFTNEKLIKRFALRPGENLYICSK